ncbi:TRAP transporter small permease [Paenibacillus hexagrammi]|uniref:TRAP transporter small permease n=1 Tax=Paenibacillus hexagrammi TaxID=2908839 RepID=A0ABY3SNN5_9BACL|nr:TRAP transporter small permease [Paenibacillus sp. YPD9-1]UJF34854.1 TRAP transporter small permease [Paenibacillus sp. YPD9-1]
MKALKRIALFIDSFFENFAQVSLLVMILIVTVQVITRKLFNHVFFWSEEVTMVLLIWFSFMGIAVGFREKLHLAIDSFTVKLPPSVNKVIDKVVSVGCIAFGIYLVKYGWDFTILMKDSTLPATKLPNSVFYAVMPLTGIMVCIYSFLQLLGIHTNRHKGMEEGGH